MARARRAGHAPRGADVRGLRQESGGSRPPHDVCARWGRTSLGAAGGLRAVPSPRPPRQGPGPLNAGGARLMADVVNINGNGQQAAATTFVRDFLTERFTDLLEDPSGGWTAL